MKPEALCTRRPVPGPGRRSISAFLGVVLTLSWALGCHDAPTQPTPGPEPTRTPAPPLDLNGEWSGTFRGEQCATPEAIHVRLSHVEGRIRGYFEMSCFAPFRWVELDGELSRVWLNVNDQHACLMSSVAATPTSFVARSRSSNLCVGAVLSLTRSGE